eukprot:jgi/Bigna1/90235/estExt_fgenesh1_pg.C_650112
MYADTQVRRLRGGKRRRSRRLMLQQADSGPYIEGDAPRAEGPVDTFEPRDNENDDCNAKDFEFDSSYEAPDRPDGFQIGSRKLQFLSRTHSSDGEPDEWERILFGDPPPSNKSSSSEHRRGKRGGNSAETTAARTSNITTAQEQPPREQSEEDDSDCYPIELIEDRLRQAGMKPPSRTLLRAVPPRERGRFLKAIPTDNGDEEPEPLKEPEKAVEVDLPNYEAFKAKEMQVMYKGENRTMFLDRPPKFTMAKERLGAIPAASLGAEAAEEQEEFMVASTQVKAPRRRLNELLPKQEQRRKPVQAAAAVRKEAEEGDSAKDTIEAAMQKLKNVTDRGKLERLLDSVGDKLKEKLKERRNIAENEVKIERLIEEMKRLKTNGQRINYDKLSLEMGGGELEVKNTLYDEYYADEDEEGQDENSRASLGLGGENSNKRNKGGRARRGGDDYGDSCDSSNVGRERAPGKVSTDEGIDGLDMKESRTVEADTRKELSGMSFFGENKGTDWTNNPLLACHAMNDPDNQLKTREEKMEEVYAALPRWTQVYAYLDVWLSDQSVLFLADKSIDPAPNLGDEEEETRNWILSIVDSRLMLELPQVLSSLGVQATLQEEVTASMRELVLTFFVREDEVSIPKLDNGQWQFLALTLMEAQARKKIPAIKHILKSQRFELIEFEELCTLF